MKAMIVMIGGYDPETNIDVNEDEFNFLIKIFNAINENSKNMADPCIQLKKV